MMASELAQLWYGKSFVVARGGLQKRRLLMVPHGVRRLAGHGAVLVADAPWLLGGTRVLHAGAGTFQSPARLSVEGTPVALHDAEVVGWLDQQSLVVRYAPLGIPTSLYVLKRP